MTTLNRRLQLAILNRKKGRNALEKGFTLVELMIVIVIVGILSAVALPNFLNQTSKAKATECTSKAGSMMGQVGAEALNSVTAATALLNEFGSAATSGGTNPNSLSDLCTFSSGGAPSGGVYTMTVVGKAGSDLEDKYGGKFCVNYETGKKGQATTGDSTTAGMTALTAPTC